MRFIYTAKKSTGEIYEGEREAADKFVLYKELREVGESVLKASPVSSGKGFSNIFHISFGSGVKTQEKIIFARNLGAMLEAGLAVTRALEVLEKQSSNKALKKILTAIMNDISNGKTFSDSLDGYKNVFSPLFRSMVRAGEESGMLAGSLKIIATQMDRSYTLERKVRGSLMYPGVILGVMIIIGILMLTYIVPTLTATFRDLKITLPLSTRIVVAVSDALRTQGFWVLIILAVIGYFVYVWARSPQGKKIVHYAILRLPVFGELVREVNAARTARTLSSLLTSGVAVVESVHIATDVLQNVHYKKILIQAEEEIKKGTPMSKIFIENSKLYPVFLGEMMSVGEETGKVGEMLLGVAVYYEEDIEQRTKDMSTIIEPFLMVFIGAAVGFFAISMISPMYSLVNII